ncbi:hypothetical protein ACET3Z_005715 [Daucus carota]
MVTAYQKRIPRVILESDNVHAYEILLDQDGDMIEEEENRAALCMAQYGMSHVSSLVEVPQPFAELQEKLDMDVGSGPHVDFLDVQPNFGNGELMHGGGKAAPIDLTGEDEDEGAGPGGN